MKRCNSINISHKYIRTTHYLVLLALKAVKQHLPQQKCSIWKHSNHVLALFLCDNSDISSEYNVLN
jgi:hypothetical protein